jgi:hypothetical protein
LRIWLLIQPVLMQVLDNPLNLPQRGGRSLALDVQHSFQHDNVGIAFADRSKNGASV